MLGVAGIVWVMAKGYLVVGGFAEGSLAKAQGVAVGDLLKAIDGFLLIDTTRSVVCSLSLASRSARTSLGPVGQGGAPTMPAHWHKAAAKASVSLCIPFGSILRAENHQLELRTEAARGQ